MFLLSLQSRFYLGDVGNGAAMKLVVNMIMGRLANSQKMKDKQLFFFLV